MTVASDSGGSRRCNSRRVAEQGEATIEFIFGAVMFLLPLIYLILVLGQIQAATFATETAARQASRLLSVPGNDPTLSAAAISLTYADYGFDFPVSEVWGTGAQISCVAQCGQAGEINRLDLSFTVPLPGMPLSLTAATGVPVRTHILYTMEKFHANPDA